MTGLSWFQIFRLGLVQTALGAIVVLSTSTINRVMVVELALPAMLPGFLVGLHYAVQLSRPRWGYDSDMGGRRTPWILGGMLILAIGGVAAAACTAWMVATTAGWLGIVLAMGAYLLIGIGVGAAGTSLLAMLAARCAPGRRAAAAATVWLMMIAGFVITASSAGHFLDPFSPRRLVLVTTVVAAAAFLLTVAAVLGLERKGTRPPSPGPEAPSRPEFFPVLRQIWSEPKARAFTVFVFMSMLAYSTQDLILEPFAGSVFGMTPGESTKLAGVQHSGVFVGMLLVGFAASGRNGPRLGSTRLWTVGGCIASGLMLLGLACAGFVADWPLRASVALLGLANGTFAVAAIGWMMTLAGEGASSREGVRMGLWGAAQAIAFALGGFLGTVGVDLIRALVADPVLPYATVFAGEGALFFVAAFLAARIPVGPKNVQATCAPTLVEEYT